MNIGEGMTRLKNTLNGYDEGVQEVLGNSYMYAVFGQAVLEMRKELRVPVNERDLGLLSGKRGVNLPTDWLEFLGEPQDIRINPDGQNTEGDIVLLVPESALVG